MSRNWSVVNLYGCKLSAVTYSLSCNTSGKPMLLSLFAVFFSLQIPSATPFDTPVSHDSLTVYVFLHDECVISQFFTPQLSKLNKQSANKKVGFVGYFPDATVGPERITAFGKKFGLEFPLLQDADQVLTSKMGIRIMPEVAVWDHGQDKMIYRGRIDDSYVRVGKRRLHPQSHDLRNVIEAWIAGETLSFRETQAIGCIIGRKN